MRRVIFSIYLIIKNTENDYFRQYYKVLFSDNKSLQRSNAMKPLKLKVSITLDAEVIDAVKELAEQDDRSFSQYINLVLKEHLMNKGKEDGRNKEH